VLSWSEAWSRGDICLAQEGVFVFDPKEPFSGNGVLVPGEIIEVDGLSCSASLVYPIERENLDLVYPGWDVRPAMVGGDSGWNVRPVMVRWRRPFASRENLLSARIKGAWAAALGLGDFEKALRGGKLLEREEEARRCPIDFSSGIAALVSFHFIEPEADFLVDPGV
jgi:hypothetical protein